MKFDIRCANHPDNSKRYDTAELRKYYHISNIFEKDAINVGGDSIPTANLLQ